MLLKENLTKVRENIAAAAVKSGRQPEDVTLVAVTKTISSGVMNELIALGVKNIGESKMQDSLRKYPQVTKGAAWHLIGHLQTNKVRDAVKIFDYIHSVDSVNLAAQISRRASEIKKVIKIFVEVNISSEISKYGLKENDAEYVLREVERFSNIEVVGLMTMAPVSDDPEKVRPYFRRLRELRDRLNLKELSMGMSQDYEVAVEEGATFVRVGTALFC